MKPSLLEEWEGEGELGGESELFGNGNERDSSEWVLDWWSYEIGLRCSPKLPIKRKKWRLVNSIFSVSKIYLLFFQNKKKDANSNSAERGEFFNPQFN